ncbi:cytochrome p450 82a3-like protein [Trifolium pratense]|uniref:Cytochrome p450 82a3-like protein n=1 Tax=Trifolium pratense TaxID=57577 RepID=A0A2K3PDP1_TRIPR|nr:cytochrome P450 CYP82D47-like [Trifolium pratense]PNY06674.1 cytochrome p450 82a3-like protein [Trifolium pratense]PNY13413.1 cytochrome p450 82a3-like protein [Trifolium pratense]
MDEFLLKTIISTILTLLIGALIYHIKKTHGQRHTPAPQAGGSWPIIGHLHLFGTQQLTHKTLGMMADKHGPIFTIKLGSYKVLILSSSEMAKECFTIHDKTFSTRPYVAASKLMGYNYAMFGFTPYGPYWREIRKLTTHELLSNHRLELLKNTRVSEVDSAVRELYRLWTIKGCPEGGVLVDMKQWFGDLTQNIALKMVGGKTYNGAGESEGRKYKEAMRDWVCLFGVFVLSDAIPFLGWLDINGHEKAMKKTAKKLDTLVEGWLEEHKKKRALGKNGEEEQDFMDIMLNVLQDSEICGYDSDTIIKATCLNLILAGSDTIMVALIWALSLLVNHPMELKKAQDELNTHIGKDMKVEESDIKNLVYLQAIVKETVRLYPPSPIITLRSAMNDCTFSCGYHIPAGTQLMVNTWKIHRDSRVWADPHDFKPERFLTSYKDVDVRSQNYELVPFGSGRRVCPGASLAMRVVQLTLARLLHSFNVATPSNQAVDMTESPGLTNLKATPLEVVLTPRLDTNLYG